MMPGASEHILPVLLVIVVGYAVRRLGLIDDPGRSAIERLTYYLLFPCLIFLSLATTDFAEFPTMPAGATMVSAMVVMAMSCLGLRPLLSGRLGMDGPTFTALFQGAVRWNTFIGLAVAGSLYGSDGLALISVAIVAIVPLANLMSVLVLARYAAKSAPTPGLIAAALLRNPFIWACAVGLLANGLGVLPPAPLTASLDMIGRAAVAVGLIAVGAGLDLRALRRPSGVLLTSTALKLVVMPLLGLGFAALYGVEGPALGVVIIAMAVPTATNAYVLAREMNGAAPLMAQIITFQTALSMATLPVWLARAAA
jgi:malonate transporter and related proteins